MKKLLYFIQLPPPIHGVSTINHQIYTSILINTHIKKYLLEIKFSNRISQLRKINLLKFVFFFTIFLKLIVKILQVKPDFIYFSLMPAGFGFWRDFIFVITIKAFRIKLIYHLHNRGIEKATVGSIKRALYNFVFNDTDIIHLDPLLSKHEFKYLNKNRFTIHIVPNGIPFIYHEKVKEIRKDRLTFLFISNIFERKGVFLLLDVFSKLLEKYTDLQLRIIGDFNNIRTRTSFFNAINSKELHHNITYLGSKYGKEKYEEYNNADIFIFPSYEECFPLVILEAMQSEIPIITSDCGAIPRILNHESALICRTGIIDDFILNAERLINNQYLRKQIALNGKEIFLQHYTLDTFEHNMFQVMNRIIGVDTISNNKK